MPVEDAEGAPRRRARALERGVHPEARRERHDVRAGDRTRSNAIDAIDADGVLAFVETSS
jgi:hypothetical protein